MKIRAEALLIKNTGILYKKILVTGSDETFIKHIEQFILKKFKEQNYFIDNSGDINPNVFGGLFSEKKVLFLVNDFSSKTELLEKISKNDHSVLISSSNNKKVNTIKSVFLNSKDMLLVECYPLNRKSKEAVLSGFTKKENLQISNDVFWYIVDFFNNDYVFFIKQLQTLSLFNKKIELIEEVERVVLLENKTEINKMFFHVFKNNKLIIKAFNENICSASDFYIFLNSLKLYLNIISNSSNIDVAQVKFPRYLFNEKEVFLKIYQSLNKKKITVIYKNILKAERLIRKNPSLYSAVSLRFFLNTKNIIFS